MVPAPGFLRRCGWVVLKIDKIWCQHHVFFEAMRMGAGVCDWTGAFIGVMRRGYLCMYS
jgi:hypothetical protein